MVTAARGRLNTVRGPFAGRAHDMRPLRDIGLPALPTGAAYVFTDLGYRGNGDLTPCRVRDSVGKSG
jgi:hypothetical protein